MLFSALLVFASVADPNASERVHVQARAQVRIVQAERINVEVVGSKEKSSLLRQTSIDRDGQVVIEFF